MCPKCGKDPCECNKILLTAPFDTLGVTRNSPQDLSYIFDSHRKAAFDFGRCVLLPDQRLHHSGYNISHGSDYEYGCWIYQHDGGFSYCEPYTDESYNFVDHADRGELPNVVAYAHTHPVKNSLRNRKQFSWQDCGFSRTKNLPLYLCYLNDENKLQVTMHVRVCQKSTDPEKLSKAKQYPENSPFYKVFSVDDDSLDGSSDFE